MKVKKMFPDNETAPTDNAEPAEQSFYGKLSAWLRNKFGTVGEPVTVEEPAPQRLYRYRITIYTGAGAVKMGADGTDAKDAEQKALVNYVSRLNVKSELIG